MSDDLNLSHATHAAGPQPELGLYFSQGKGVNRGSGAEPLRGPGTEPLVRESGAKPPKAESISVVGCPKEMENGPQFYCFTTCSLFSKNVLRLYATMLW